MKIQILELEKHRNETTFRPYINATHTLNDYDIKFVEKNPDIYWVGQSSIVDKKVSLNESVEKGINFLKKLDAPYILFDGQDSSSLMGVWDVFKNVPGYKLAKNVLLKNYTQYTNSYINGRWFWGEHPIGYKIETEDLQLMTEKLVHSGTNWLNTFGNKLHFLSPNKHKHHDVAVMIGLCEENHEYNIKVNEYYNSPRKKLFSEVKKLKVDVITTELTGKINKDEYINILYNSKLCISPFGYGEINIREIECLITATPFIKPNIDCIKTTPFIYQNNNILNCSNNFSDIKDVVDHALTNYKDILEILNYQRETFVKTSSDQYIVNHLINNILQ